MKVLVKTQKLFLLIASVIITIALFLAVIFRYILKIDLFGIEELLIIPTFTLYFIAAAQASYEQNHIAADLLESYLGSEKIKQLVNVLNSLVILIVCVILTYWNIQNVMWIYQQGAKTSGWGIPLVIPHTIVLIGFVLMTLHTLIHLLNYIKLFKQSHIKEY